MKVRRTSTSDDQITLQMTPMIDIVFQLLTFFIMSLKIAAAEGDFNIKMPLAAPREGVPDERQSTTYHLRMVANPDGSLKTLRLDDKTLGSNIASPAQAAGAFQALHNEIITRVGDDRGPGSVAKTDEVEISADYNLSYENVIAAITSVSGYINPKDGKSIVKLMEKIKFAPPPKEPGT
jgi:biopolymer transport protein ExbD